MLLRLHSWWAWGYSCGASANASVGVAAAPVLAPAAAAAGTAAGAAAAARNGAAVVLVVVLVVAGSSWDAIHRHFADLTPAAILSLLFEFLSMTILDEKRHQRTLKAFVRFN